MREHVRHILDRRHPPAVLPPAPTRGSKTVLVLSGGGLLGAAQAGMLDVLCRSGVHFDAVVGVSVGALNGAFIATDPRPDRGAELIDMWRGLPKRGVFQGKAVERLWALLARHEALHSSDALRAVIERAVAISDLSESVTPIHVVTCNLATGEPTWWNAGPTTSVLLASAAIPGALPPVAIDGVDHVDGGVITNVPIAKAVALGATRIICLDVSAALRPVVSPDTAVGVLLRAFAASRNALTAAEFAAVPSDVELHHLRVEGPSKLGLADFARVNELIELGRSVAQRYLEGTPLADGGPMASRAPQRRPVLSRFVPA